MKKLIVVVILGFAAGALANAPRLEKLPVDPNQITVSGVSAGAMMAVQMNVIHSTWVKGVGSIAGGTFGCAEGDVQRAQDLCMKDPGHIDVNKYTSQITSLAQAGQIDPVTDLQKSRVFIYAGTKDSVILPEASGKLLQMYKAFVGGSQIATRSNIASEHGQPTLNYGVPCDTLRLPWLNSCGYDAAGEALSTLYGKLNPRGQADPTHMSAFSQSEFSTSDSTLLANGYIYVPKGCESNSHQGLCRLHIVFHGCQQNPNYVKDAYRMHAGYNEWAETNKIVVLYPSAGFSMSNPSSCWDWWGYTGKNYLTRFGSQIQSITKMAERITGTGLTMPRR